MAAMITNQARQKAFLGAEGFAAQKEDLVFHFNHVFGAERAVVGLQCLVACR